MLVLSGKRRVHSSEKTNHIFKVTHLTINQFQFHSSTTRARPYKLLQAFLYT
jgi:hypothetical protein